jgi:hypothetical protein
MRKLSFVLVLLAVVYFFFGDNINDVKDSATRYAAGTVELINSISTNDEGATNDNLMDDNTNQGDNDNTNTPNNQTYDFDGEYNVEFLSVVYITGHDSLEDGLYIFDRTYEELEQDEEFALPSFSNINEGNQMINLDLELTTPQKQYTFYSFASRAVSINNNGNDVDVRIFLGDNTIGFINPYDGENAFSGIPGGNLFTTNYERWIENGYELPYSEILSDNFLSFTLEGEDLDIAINGTGFEHGEHYTLGEIEITPKVVILYRLQQNENQ